MKIFLLVLFWSLSTQAQNNTPFFNDIEQVRKAAPQLDSEYWKLKSTSAQKLSGSLFWTPKLNASLGRASATSDDVRQPDTDSWKVSADWEFSLGGSQIHAMSAGGSAEKAQQLKLSGEKVQTEGRAANLIFQVLSLRDQLQIQKEVLEKKEESLKIIKGRFQQGRLPLQEVQKAEVDLSLEQTNAAQLELNQSLNESALRALFLDQLRTKTWPFSETLKIRLENKPSLDLQHLSSLTEQFESAYKSTRAGHFPVLGASVGYGSSRPSDTRVWTNEQTVLLTLTIPLWNQYETSAIAAGAFAKYMSAKNDETIADRAEKENRVFLQKKLQVSRDNVLQSRRNFEKSESLYKDILRTFRMGRVTTNELLEEQARVRSTRQNYSQSLLSFHQAVIEICALQGKLLRDCLN